jgi:hypothetical protein
MGFTRTALSATTAAVTNRFVTSTNMKVGAYTLANTTAAHGAGFKVTATITPVTGNDTAGTLTVVGTDLAGAPLTEVITLTDGVGGSGSAIFKSLTSVTGAGWVINTGNDTIIVGQAADAYVMGSSGVLHGILVTGTTATSIAPADAAGGIGTLAASIANGLYLYDCDVSGFLKITHAGTSVYTVIHSHTIPNYLTT